MYKTEPTVRSLMSRFPAYSPGGIELGLSFVLTATPIVPWNGRKGNRVSRPLVSLTAPYHLPRTSRMGENLNTLLNFSGCDALASASGGFVSGNSPGNAPLP